VGPNETIQAVAAFLMSDDENNFLFTVGSPMGIFFTASRIPKNGGTWLVVQEAPSTENDCTPIYLSSNFGTSLSLYQSCPTLTASCPDDATVVDSDGKSYDTVQIGSQCWLRHNLNKKTDNSSCYDNNENNCAMYGSLYAWNDAMKNSVSEGAQGICPNGWHVPTHDEYLALINYLGGQTSQEIACLDPVTILELY
jgi:hypothetical protein